MCRSSPCADQHFDAPIALPAFLRGVAALEPHFAEGSRRDLAGGHPGAPQRLANGVHSALAERLVVLVAAAWIRVAVDAEDHGRILLQVRRDLGHLARLVRPQVRLVEIEQDVLELRPADHGDRTRLTLYARRAHRAHRAARTLDAGSTVRTSRALRP